MPQYPGMVFAGDSPDLKALVGMPSGYGAAYLLIDHKSQFGATRRVQSIRIWTAMGAPYVLLTFDKSDRDVAGHKRPADDEGGGGEKTKTQPGSSSQAPSQPKAQSRGVNNFLDKLRSRLFVLTRP